jgi:hypothetical protein
MEVPRVFAAASAMLLSTFTGTRVVLWKLIERPVAFAKLSRIFFQVFCRLWCGSYDD